MIIITAGRVQNGSTHQWTWLDAPLALLPAHWSVAVAVMVPLLPYLASMQMFRAWFDPFPAALTQSLFSFGPRSALTQAAEDWARRETRRTEKPEGEASGEA